MATIYATFGEEGGIKLMEIAECTTGAEVMQKMRAWGIFGEDKATGYMIKNVLLPLVDHSSVSSLQHELEQPVPT